MSKEDEGRHSRSALSIATYPVPFLTFVPSNAAFLGPNALSVQSIELRARSNPLQVQLIAANLRMNPLSVQSIAIEVELIALILRSIAP